MCKPTPPISVLMICIKNIIYPGTAKRREPNTKRGIAQRQGQKYSQPQRNNKKLIGRHMAKWFTHCHGWDAGWHACCLHPTQIWAGCMQQLCKWAAPRCLGHCTASTGLFFALFLPIVRESHKEIQTHTPLHLFLLLSLRRVCGVSKMSQASQTLCLWISE